MRSAWVITALLVPVAATAETMADEEQRVAEAREVTDMLFEELSGELQAAMQDGGPAEAISVCRDRAPAIKRRLSLERGWEVTRVGTRTRNPLLGLPHAWQRDVLADFEDRRADGEDMAELEFAETEETSAGREFRYMRAIGTQEACMTCHGAQEDLPEDIRNALAEEYPQDQATGYQVGDLRGAFSIRYLVD